MEQDASSLQANEIFEKPDSVCFYIILRASAMSCSEWQADDVLMSSTARAVDALKMRYFIEQFFSDFIMQS